jgi:ClpP class serine protease
MSQSSESEPSAAQRIRDASTALRSHRSRPCLLYVSRQVEHSDVLAVREACAELETDVLDVVISSPGGDLEAAYLVARELRRRLEHLCVYVPFRAKSAASLICLAADELVLGSLGELGPLDQQYDEKMAADFPLSTSRLLLQTALTDLQPFPV